MKFRKKPVVIDAIPVRKILRDAGTNWDALPDWFVSAYDQHRVIIGDKQLYVDTLEGQMIAQKTDWLIRGIQGELYPCKEAIFEATYERVAEAEDDVRA